jgi:uncharacterized lipoprotein NlpE involved in copper resistance
MTAYKDAKHDSLSSIEATKSSVDMEHTLLQQMLENRLEADTTGSTQDLWHRLWDTWSVAAGSFQDRARDWLINRMRVTQGSLNQMWSEYWELLGVASFPLTHSILPDYTPTGDSPTFTRATSATFEDFEGVIRTAESSEPRFVGARRVENLLVASQNFADASWNVDTTTTLTPWVSDPNGTTTASTVTADGTNSVIGSYLTGLSGETYVFSAWVRRRTGSGTISLIVGDNVQQAITTTSSWQRFAVSDVTSSTNLRAYFVLVTSGDEIDIAFAQLELVSGQTNQNPSEYVSTGVANGPELVTNGAFSNGTTDWTALYGTQSVVGGQLEVISDGSASSARSYQIITCLVGKTYLVSGYINPIGGITAQILVNINTNTGSPSGTTGIQASAGTYSFTFIATQTNMYVTLAPSTTTSGFGGAFDNISLKEASHGANIDGVQYFNRLNANTVTAGVVTEATGSALTRANTQFGELDGVAGDYFSTPNVVTTWGELDIRVRAQIDSIDTAWGFLADKRSTFFLGMLSTKQLGARIGANPDFSSSIVPSVFGVRNWYRFTYDAATGDAKFFTADGNLEAPEISDYVQFGTTLNQGVLTVPVNANGFYAGTYGAIPNAYPFDGRIYRSQVFNEIDGTTPVVDFTAGSYVSGSTLVSSTSGETWTLNGNASVFQPPVDASGPFGYLAEGARTNILLQSNDLSTTWSNTSNSVDVQNYAIAPDGSSTGQRIIDSSVGGTGSVRMHQAIGSLSTTTQYVYSAFFKADQLGFVKMAASSFTIATPIAFFDLTNGLVGTGSNTDSAAIESVGNGWYRCWISFTTDASDIAGDINIYVADSVSNATVDLDGTSSILVWGAQLEAGSFPSSYIATAAAAVTRNADTLSSSLNEVYPLTAYAETVQSVDQSSGVGNSYTFAVNENTTPSQDEFYIRAEQSAVDYQGVVYSGSTAVANIQGGAPAAGVLRTLTMAVALNDVEMYVDGVSIGSDTSAALPAAPTLMNIGMSGSASTQPYATVRNVKLFNKRLTDAEVAKL